MIEFRVDGKPATKGSWKVTRHGGLRPDNERERPWANAVAWCARAAGVRIVAEAPVSVEIALYFASPKKPTHSYPSRNDVDKLARSVLDALTGVAWQDDQQVTRLAVTKAYGSPGAVIRIGAAS